jgi:Ca-activated chloride channel family protein
MFFHTPLKPEFGRLTAVLLLPLLFAHHAEATPTAPPRQVEISAKLSQTRFVQNEANTVFLDVSISAPSLPDTGTRPRATDMIIVLDRSGSMSEDNKMPYAKAAVWDIIGRLNESDRFALVSFADNALVQSPLVTVSATNKGVLNNLVSQITPSGSTNMSDGLNAALQLLEHSAGEGARKIVLLSDGQANQGITDPELLGQMAARATHHGAVLSTIGMGLGFNEALMAKLADHGMGHYAYLEDLSGLGNVLNRDLNETLRIYAHSSTLEISLADGVRLVDAGGYPVNPLTGSAISIPTGQLLAGTAKHFVMTFTIPNAAVGNLALGDMKLNYGVEGATQQTALDAAKLKLAVVAPERRQEAVNSIDKNIYQQSWLENNLGLVKKKIGEMVRSGNKPAAKQAISEYRKEMKAAEAAASVPLTDAKLDEKLKKLESEVDEAFTGSAPEQDVKRNRAAKSMQYEGIKDQRKSK